MTTGPTPADFAHHRRRGLPRWVLVALAAGLAGGAHAQSRIADARSGPDPALREILVAAIADANSFDDRFDAEVWLTDMSHRLARQVPNPMERLEILTAVHRSATHAEVPPELVLAVIDVESNFDRFAISSTSALGLMQVMPFWVPELGYKDKNQLFDIETNVLLGCQILKYYLDVERGNLVQGLARYNGSVGRRSYADRVIERLRTKWFRR
jgi:soluble lytic murein transglycosylase-like protein